MHSFNPLKGKKVTSIVQNMNKPTESNSFSSVAHGMFCAFFPVAVTTFKFIPQKTKTVERNTMKQTIMFVLGTRPDLIKMARLIHEAKKRADIHPVICSTGQHKEMLENLYKLFDFEPDEDFKLMKPNQSLVHLHSETMIWMHDVIEKYKPSWVVVNGDTTTAHAAAMTAFYLKVPVAQVEAGLRTYDIGSPFPEEMNRRAISLVAKAHLCPTQEAAHNLRDERIDASSFIEITGNTVIDSLHFVSEKIKTPDLSLEFQRKFSFLKKRDFILVTMHRRENFGQAQKEVLQAFLDIVQTRNIDILFPVHPNPNVRASVDDIYKNEYGENVIWLTEANKNFSASSGGRIFLTDPFDYLEFVYAMKHCKFIMTDSGGMQEEAPSFAKKLLVLRQSTERPEGVAAGFSQVVGTDRQGIVNEAHKLIDKEDHWENQVPPLNPYGDGFSSARIMGILANPLLL